MAQELVHRADVHLGTEQQRCCGCPQGMRRRGGLKGVGECSVAVRCFAQTAVRLSSL